MGIVMWKGEGRGDKLGVTKEVLNLDILEAHLIQAEICQNGLVLKYTKHAFITGQSLFEDTRYLRVFTSGDLERYFALLLRDCQSKVIAVYHEKNVKIALENNLESQLIVKYCYVTFEMIFMAHDICCRYM